MASASSAWDFSRSKRVRFQRVRPPLQVPMGNPKRRSSSTSRKRVAFTAAASLRGTFACAATSGCPNFCCRLVPFGLVTRVAREHQIAGSVGAAPAAWHLVVEFKGHSLLPTIRTPVAIFDQQIGAQFPARKPAVLILRPRDLRILDELHVETDPLDLETADRCEASIPSRPGHDVVHAGADRRRQPASWTSSIEKARGAVSQVGRSPAPAAAACFCLPSSTASPRCRTSDRKSA